MLLDLCSFAEYTGFAFEILELLQESSREALVLVVADDPFHLRVGWMPPFVMYYLHQLFVNASHLCHDP